MLWLAFLAAAAVLLISAYALVRLRHHETDPVPGAERDP